MSRVVCISNRVSLPDPQTGEIKAGGLAVGVKAALESNGGGMWFGWNGDICPNDTVNRKISLEQHGSISFCTIPLRKRGYEYYYKAMSNESLWPLMHGMADHINPQLDPYRIYKNANNLFARKLKPYLKPSDVIWVHDYHLIPLGRELRKMGVKNRIGYFHHTPVPSQEFLEDADLPQFLKLHYHKLVEDLFKYDLVGFQSFRDFKNFRRYTSNPKITPKRYTAATLHYKNQHTNFGVFPIGIETQDVALDAKRNACGLENTGKRMIIGAERLDYTKGIKNRLEGFYRFLKQNPHYREAVSYNQICPLSRADIDQYKSTIQETRDVVNKIEDEFCDGDVRPLDYTEDGLPREELMSHFRNSDVGLVTPLIDGQNLVAKEYIASQDPRNPGMLVLSRGAGAAEQLEDCGVLCVDPTNPDDIAEKIKQALEMPLIERIEVYRNAFALLSEYDIEHWSESFLSALKQSAPDHTRSAPSIGGDIKDAYSS